MKMFFEAALGGLQARVAVLESVVELFSDLLPAPKLFVSETVSGFRYENPDVRHFCLLKAVRTVSALNASLELAQKGYTQEIAALMRIVTECTRHIEYALDVDDSAEHRSNVEKYLRDFFDDVQREPEAAIKGVLIREKQINEQLGKTLDRIAIEYGDSVERVPAAQLFHRSSRSFSFYLHARYPETMDLYGGLPGRWHLRGMGKTPKDRENLEVLDTFITTASMTFVIMVQGITQLQQLVLRHPKLRQWYAECVGA
jgi:hypothetical protein